MEATTAAIYEIVEKALEGKGLADADVRTLYALDPASKEAYYINWAATQLSKRASNGKAEIHAQIGLNGTPCPKNCQFCSFAVCNGVRKGKLEMPKDYVVEFAKIYEDQGANAILMLSTASYSFELFLEMAVAVRAVISKELPLLANIADQSPEMARRLKAAGVDGCYHAVRMGEGVVTSLSVADRLATFEHIHAAGLSLSTCVEPIGPEHTAEELTEKTRICIDSGALSAGCGRRIGVPGTALYDLGMISTLRNGFYVAVYRLACGLFPRLNCVASTDLMANAGANLTWAEVGANPRDLEQLTEKGGRGKDIAFYREMYTNADWEILEGPSPGWQLG
jgi:biotin synthase